MKPFNKKIKNKFKQRPNQSLRRPVVRSAEQQGSGVFSYHSYRARGDVPLGRTVEKDRPAKRFAWRQWRFLPSWLAFLAILISFGYLLTLDTNPRIIVPADNATVLLRDKDVYQQAARNFLDSSLANRSKITVDTLALSRNLQQRFPEIASASVTLPLASRRPIITLTPAQPALILSTRGGLFVLDTKGRAILTADDATSSVAVNLPLVTDESGLSVEVGKSALPSTAVSFIHTLVAQLAAKQFTPETMTLPAVANELHIRISGQPYFVKFNTASDPRQSAGAFLALKQRLEGEGQSPSQYIDLRIAERAYYK